MMNNTITRVTASEARNSTWVSLGFASASCSFSDIGSSASSASQLPDNPESTVPAGELKYMQHGMDEMKKFITCRRRLWHLVIETAQRPINDQWTSNHIFLRYKSPVTAVVTVIPVVPHHEIVAGRN